MQAIHGIKNVPEELLEKSYSLCDLKKKKKNLATCPTEVPAISVDTMYNLLIWRILKNLCNLKVTDILYIVVFCSSFCKYVFFHNV